MKRQASKFWLVALTFITCLLLAVACVAGCAKSSVYEINGAQDVYITTEETEYDFLAGVTGTKDGEAFEVTCDSSAVEFGVVGSYDVVYTCGSENKTVKCHISEPVAAYVLELTKYEEAFAASATAESVQFDKSSYVLTAKYNGGDATGDVVISGEVKWGTAGEYEIVYTLGNVEKILKVTVNEPVYVLELTQTAVSFKSVADGEGFDAAAYIGTATREGADATGDVDLSGAVNWGTAGDYTITYTLGDPSKTGKKLTLTVTVSQPVYAIDGVKDLTVRSSDKDVTDFLAGVSGTLDGEKSYTVQADDSAVDWNAAGEYDVVYTCGTLQITVKCKVYTDPVIKLKDGVQAAACATEIEKFDVSLYVEAQDCFGTAIDEFTYDKDLLVIGSGDEQTVNLTVSVSDAVGNTAQITLPVTLYTAAAYYGREISGADMSFFIKSLDDTGVNSVSWDETEGAYYLDNSVQADDNKRVFVLDTEYLKGVRQYTGAVSVALWVKPEKENCEFYAEFIKDGNWEYDTTKSWFHLYGSQNTQQYRCIVFSFSDFLDEGKAPMLLTIGGGMYVKGIEFAVPKAEGETAASMFIAKDMQYNGAVYDADGGKFVLTNSSTDQGDKRFFIINPDYISAMREQGYTHISFSFNQSGEFYIMKYSEELHWGTLYKGGWDAPYDYLLVDISEYSDGETIGFLKAAQGSFEISGLSFSKKQTVDFTAENFDVAEVTGIEFRTLDDGTTVMSSTASGSWSGKTLKFSAPIQGNAVSIKIRLRAIEEGCTVTFWGVEDGLNSSRTMDYGLTAEEWTEIEIPADKVTYYTSEAGTVTGFCFANTTSGGEIQFDSIEIIYK